MVQLQQDIQVRSNEAQRESRKKDKLDRELRQSRTELDTKSSEIKTLQQQVERYKQDISKTEQQLKEQRIASERSEKEVDVLNARFTKLSNDYEQQLVQLEQLHSENSTRATDLKVNY